MRNWIFHTEKIIRFIVYSNIWLALSVFLWTLQTLWLNDSLHAWQIAVFSASSTLFAYNYQRLAKLRRKDGDYVAGRPNWIVRKKQEITWIAVFGAVSTLAMVPFLTMKDLLLLVIPVAFSNALANSIVLPKRRSI